MDVLAQVSGNVTAIGYGLAAIGPGIRVELRGELSSREPRAEAFSVAETQAGMTLVADVERDAGSEASSVLRKAQTMLLYGP